MPTYLLHGFRWPRPLIRIHIILQNIDDAAAEWLVAPGTTTALLENFHELWPEAMTHLPNLRFIEQYDPEDTSATAASQPYAYVADVVEEVRLGIDVDEVRGRGVGNDQWGALMEIRDKLAPDEKVGWYIVVCGDEERWAPPTVDLLRGGIPAREGTNGVDVAEQKTLIAAPQRTSGTGSSGSGSDARAVSPVQPVQPVQPKQGMRRWFRTRGSFGKKMSTPRATVREIVPSDSDYSTPSISITPPPVSKTAVV